MYIYFCYHTWRLICTVTRTSRISQSKKFDFSKRDYIHIHIYNRTRISTCIRMAIEWRNSGYKPTIIEHFICIHKYTNSNFINGVRLKNSSKNKMPITSGLYIYMYISEMYRLLYEQFNDKITTKVTSWTTSNLFHELTWIYYIWRW